MSDSDSVQQLETCEKQRQVSVFTDTVSTLVQGKPGIKPMEDNLILMEKGIDDIISTKLIGIEEVDKIKDTVRETKDNAKEAQCKLDTMKSCFHSLVEPFHKSRSLARLKTLGELDSFLSGLGSAVNKAADLPRAQVVDGKKTRRDLSCYLLVDLFVL